MAMAQQTDDNEGQDNSDQAVTLNSKNWLFEVGSLVTFAFLMLGMALYAFMVPGPCLS